MTVRRAYRYVVVGAGGIGSAAAYWLSRTAGEDVLCLEQWALGHGRGASEDHSRIIRLGYHAARYTALTPASYEAWGVVQEESGVPLVRRTGMVNIARPGTEGAGDPRRLRGGDGRAGIPYERLDAAEVGRRWPQFRLPDDMAGLFQPDGGILDIRKAGAVHWRWPARAGRPCWRTRA